MEDNRLALVNQIISEISDKSLIHDGVLTLGELHSDRCSLYLNLIEVYSKFLKLSGSEFFLWTAPSVIKGYVHLGLSLKDSTSGDLAGIFPSILNKSFIELGAIELKEPRPYKTISETLKQIK